MSPARPGESQLSHLIPLNPGESRLKKRVRSHRPGRSGERRKTEGGGGTQAAMTAGSPSPPSGGEGRGEVGRRAGCGLALVADETIRMALARCQQVGGRVPDSAGGRRPPLLGAPRACATCAGEGRKCRAMMRDADTALHGTSVKVDPSLSSNYMAAESAARAAGHLSERESVFCIRLLKGLKSPARSTAYSVPGAPVWQARALRPAGPSLRLKRIYRRSGGLPIVPAAVSGCSSLSAAMMSAIRVFTSLSDASRGL